MTKIVETLARETAVPKRRRTIALANAPLVAVLAGFLGACSTGSDGYNDGTVVEAPDKALVRSILGGLGAVDPSEKPIEYAPRAPLAMPTNLHADLPPPEKAETAANWPQASDAELQKLREAYATSPLTGNRLTPEQLRGLPQLASSNERDLVAERKAQDEIDGKRLSPDELTKKRTLTKVDTSKLLDANGQPIRRYLIEPPVEYSTPAGDAPLVAPEKNEKPVDLNEWERTARPIPLN
ncbi:hypothetical protein H2509_17925 [Stappia sp. F7233]|uniref:DUF3035 domain-containing protein n=1 Tax=Stappia albiluteola TaxID=2758565 RepID=A0A839AGM5_9HYPH|nr:hypothetical protein [Stappia albiluteola]MBA5779010.1 hypothetical protein [Stappia albiluteola]